ncbi:MAG: hypothetical protein M5U26_02405 [Planctomycetota bacterium]|nr:hypothetical protein [Planctomycetota bacterium]
MKSSMEEESPNLHALPNGQPSRSLLARLGMVVLPLAGLGFLALGLLMLVAGCYWEPIEFRYFIRIKESSLPNAVDGYHLIILPDAGSNALYSLLLPAAAVALPLGTLLLCLAGWIYIRRFSLGSLMLCMLLIGSLAALPVYLNSTLTFTRVNLDRGAICFRSSDAQHDSQIKHTLAQKLGFQALQDDLPLSLRKELGAFAAEGWTAELKDGGRDRLLVFSFNTDMERRRRELILEFAVSLALAELQEAYAGLGVTANLRDDNLNHETRRFFGTRNPIPNEGKRWADFKADWEAWRKQRLEESPE